jgi:ankyrin repeat protein
MAIKTSWSLWLLVLGTVARIHGEPYPKLISDVGDFPDANTGPLLTDLNNGLDPNNKWINGWTALHVAAGLNKPNMVAMLKLKGANLNIQDSSSYTPLHVAAGLDSVDVINQLLPGANTEIKGPNQWTALHVAVGNGFGVAIAALISGSADVNAADSHGWTPLHIGVGSNHLGAVNTLLIKAAP